MVRSTPVRPIARPVPRAIVRDLLAIARALYRAEMAKPASERTRVERLVEVGKHFRRALDMSAQYGPDTMAGRVAFEAARRGAEELGELVADCAVLTPVVAATAARLRRTRF